MAKKVYTIGRIGDVKLYSKDGTTSRRHAELIVIDGKFYLADLDSKNGTFQVLEGGRRTRFSKGWVTVNDSFAFGDCVMTVAQMLQQVGELPHSLVASPCHEPRQGVDVPGQGEDSKVSGRRIFCPNGHIQLAGRAKCSKCGEELSEWK